MLAAFTLHSANGGVQEQAMKVAGNLSYENDERTSYLVAAGVVDLVRKIGWMTIRLGSTTCMANLECLCQCT